MDTLSGKTALVTGSTSGLGMHLAMALLREGAKVIINGRNKEKFRETRQFLEVIKGEISFAHGDVTKAEDCQRIIRECVQSFGHLDILINNAGTGSNGLLCDTLPLATRKVIDLNLLGTMNITHFAMPHIRKTRGSIIFISSLAGIYGLPYCATYSISKMALTALNQALRIELSGTGVHTGIMYVGFLNNGPDKKIIGCHGQAVNPTRRPERFTMTPDKASTLIIKTIKQRRSQKVFTSMGKFLYQLNRISPLLVRKLLTKSTEKMKYNYTSEQ